MTHYVGLTGRKRSGKNTAGAAFENMGFESMSFAMPIKLMLASLLEYQGVDPAIIYRMLDDDLKEVPTPYLQGKTPRQAMQTLGTEWGRVMIGDTLWSDALIRASHGYDNVVVTDVRFPNELKALNEKGAFIYRVVRPDNPAGNDDHPSETFIDGLDVTSEIINQAPTAEAFMLQVMKTFFDDGQSGAA